MIRSRFACKYIFPCLVEFLGFDGIELIDSAVWIVNPVLSFMTAVV
jgi:hypothetical protein